jgi:hypothetical protein
MHSNENLYVVEIPSRIPGTHGRMVGFRNEREAHRLDTFIRESSSERTIQSRVHLQRLPIYMTAKDVLMDLLDELAPVEQAAEHHPEDPNR